MIFYKNRNSNFSRKITKIVIYVIQRNPDDLKKEKPRN